MSKFMLPAIAAATLALMAVPAGAQVPATPVTPDKSPNEMPVPAGTPGAAPQQMQTPAAGRMSEAQIRSSLEAQGYTQITKAELKSMDYEVTAMKDGKTVQLMVDSTTGKIRPSDVR